MQRCAEILQLSSACASPALALLATATEACVRRHRAKVVAQCARLGFADVDGAVTALAAMLDESFPGQGAAQSEASEQDDVW